MCSFVCVILCKVEVVSMGKLHLLLICSVELLNFVELVYEKKFHICWFIKFFFLTLKSYSTLPMSVASWVLISDTKVVLLVLLTKHFGILFAIWCLFRLSLIGIKRK